jgi:hypothetical protein
MVWATSGGIRPFLMSPSVLKRFLVLFNCLVLLHDDIGVFEVCHDFELDFDLILSAQQYTADGYYKERYEKPVDIDFEKLGWFPSVEPPTVPYDLSAYTPKNIRAALKQKDKNSSTGYDEVVYEYFPNMPFLRQNLSYSFHKNTRRWNSS